jgi:hypothetical protein
VNSALEKSFKAKVETRNAQIDGFLNKNPGLGEVKAISRLYLVMMVLAMAGAGAVFYNFDYKDEMGIVALVIAVKNFIL